MRVRNGFFVFVSSSSFEGLLNIRVRRLYFDLGVEIFRAIDADGVGRAVGTGVFSIDVGRRLVGVDEPNATEVFLSCVTRLTFVEFVNAENGFSVSFQWIRKLTWCCSKE